MNCVYMVQCTVAIAAAVALLSRQIYGLMHSESLQVKIIQSTLNGNKYTQRERDREIAIISGE